MPNIIMEIIATLWNLNLKKTQVRHCTGNNNNDDDDDNDNNNKK